MFRAIPRFGGPCGSILVLVLFLGVTGPIAALGQVVREDFYVTNGPVFCTAVSGNTLYAGGDFTQVGPATGGFVPTDATTGALVAGYPKVNGNINTIASDGAGGWFIGGYFTTAGGLPRSNLAHIRADLTVSSWAPDADNSVSALVVVGSTVFVGGDFTTVGGQSRTRIAALDATTGMATAWDPGANQSVWRLAVSGSTVYASGFFTTIGGQPRQYLAALDATVNTNSATAWNPNPNSLVDEIVISGTTVYVCGSFSNIGGQPRNYIAALNATLNTNNATAWNPNPPFPFIYALAVSGNTVYVGGSFDNIGGQPRNNIAALDATINTNNATAWNPGSNSTVVALSVSGSTVYAGGAFTSIGGQGRSKVAALDALVNTNNATAWNPNAGNSVHAIGVSGSRVFLGGNFTTVGGVTRNRAAAFDLTTGLPTAWNPNANERVYAMLIDGGTVYVGGQFSTIGGPTRLNIAALDPASGAATAWNPSAFGIVRALAVSGTTMYVGGEFSSIGGQNRNRIGAVTTTVNTNNATAWNPNAVGGIVRALALSGTTLYVGGEFNSIGGQSRARLAALNTQLNTNNATSWNPGVSIGTAGSALVNTLAVSGSTVYVGGDFHFIGGQARDFLGAVDAVTDINNATAWDPDPDGYIHALGIGGSTVYVGGSYLTIGGQERTGLSAIDAATNTGNALSWNPSAGDVRSITLDGSNVDVGGYFYRAGTTAQSYIAVIGGSVSGAPEAPEPPVLTMLEANHPNPFGASTRLRFVLPEPALVRLAIFDMSGRRVATVIEGERRGAGAHEIPFDAAGLASGVYALRFSADDRTETRRLVHVR